MSKRILMTGGTGFIGSHLIERWLSEGHDITVLTRRPEHVQKRWKGRVQGISEFAEAQGRFQWLVNLAGEGIADARWSDSRKQLLRESRVGLTERLVRWAEHSGQRFEVVLSGSAVGFYGGFPGAQPALTEACGPGRDYSANLCIDWEDAAAPLAKLSDRLICLRTGIVLGPRAGMLSRMWLPFRMGMGGIIGSGEQMISWIHIDDYCRATDFLLNADITGAVNMTAPVPASNADLTRALAGVLNRPACLPMPGFVASVAFGELSELLLKGQNVVPKNLSDAGFSWVYTDLRQALEQIARVW